MTRFPLELVGSFVALGCAALTLAAPASSVSAVQVTTGAGFASEPSAVEFLTERTVLGTHTTGVVPFRVAQAPVADQTFQVRVSGDSIALARNGAGQLLAGETVGFVRVTTMEPGTATLAIGGASIDVEVREPRSLAQVSRPVPVLVGPAVGAHVWGEFEVGVELPLGVRSAREIELELWMDGEPSGLLPREVEAQRGPERRVVFRVDASARNAGAVQLVAVARRGETVERSRPLALNVVHPSAGELLRFEPEDHVDAARPDGYGDNQPPVARTGGTSGGRAVVVRGADPMPIVRAQLASGGRWQVFARVRGEVGAGAFPTISLTNDAPYTYLASARVLDREWHRVPIGAPVDLDEGERVLGLRMTNAVSLGRAERRTLQIDTIELLRIPDGAAGGDAMSMMMSGDTSPSMEAASMSMMSGGDAGVRPGELWIGLHRDLDGLTVTGDLRIEGIVSWTGGAAVPAPHVDLVVDGEVFASQQTEEPIFELSPAELGPGEHVVQLSASQPGRRARITPVQTVRVMEGVVSKGPRQQYRIGLRDERWRMADGGAVASRLARPARAESASFELPYDWAGPFEVRLDARGPGAPSFAAADLRIETVGGDGAPRVLGEKSLEVQNYWNERRIGTIDLPVGRKTLHVSLNPDPGGDGTNALLQLRGVVFERTKGTDHAPPVGRVVYPRAGQLVHGLDAVVVEALDDRELVSAEVLVDGRTHDAFARPPAGAGRIVLPLWAGALAPGAHRVSVRLLDRATNECTTTEVPIEVAAEAPPKPGRFRRAVHLLDRIAYGPSAQDLGALLAMGEDAWLERALAESSDDGTARDWMRARLGPDLAYGATQLTLGGALRSANPVRSRFVFFVDNHFSTWSGKTGNPSEFGDHLRWQDLGFASFRELLLAAVTNPVLLIYLDQQESFRGRLNENFARELLELHSVGVEGGYDQGDVTRLAAILAGVTVAEEAPRDGSGQYRRRVLRFAPDLAVREGADVMGMRLPALDRTAPRSGYERVVEVVDHLAAHPSTARFLAAKLAEAYVSNPAPPALVADLERCFLTSGGDPRALLRTLATHDDFWQAMDAPRIATPFDYAVRLGRATSPRHLHSALDQYMRSAGMGLFDHASPDGYPTEDAVYVDSNAMLSRWRVAQKFPWAVRVLAPDAVRNADGTSRWSWQERAAQHAAFALLGRSLSEPSLASAVAFLNELPDDPVWQRVDKMSMLLTRLPEASQR